MITLPVIACQSGCGACCLDVGGPPFAEYLAAAGGGTDKRAPSSRESQILLRLEAEYPAAYETLLSYQKQRKEGTDRRGPCVWLDLVTRKCLHYEFRPDVCLNFEPGGFSCGMCRLQAGLAGMLDGTT